jgi:MFS family permease
LNTTSSLAIIATHYKEDRVKAMGFLEASIGLGLLIGPLVGGVLYDIGGFYLPFFVVASIYFLLYPMIASTLLEIKEKEMSNQ